VSGRFALGAATLLPNGEATAEVALGATPFRVGLDVGYEGAELTRFYGFGNETTASRADAFYEARRAAFRARVAVKHAQGDGVALSLGTTLTAVRPETLRGTLVDSVAPYGHEAFDLLSLDGTLELDRVDDAVMPRGGSRLVLSGRWVPALLDTRESFLQVDARASAYLSAEVFARPTLALRAGAQKVWGSAPYFEAPSLGGPESLRGFLSHRFTGDAALFAGAELRAEVADFVFLLPGTLGVLGLAETGRVMFGGETSGIWHGAVGGGIWASLVGEYSFSLAVARSPERITLHVGAGMPF
jgi:outer membrane protein assembly factor BamA